MVSDRLKQVIFKKLYMDLKGVEIIPYGNSIYFIDREKKYWYFEYEKNGELWWRYGFFSNFFRLFSLESNDYSIIMGEWVEEVLNYKVSSTNTIQFGPELSVEEVLNCRVSLKNGLGTDGIEIVEEVLNCRVCST